MPNCRMFISIGFIAALIACSDTNFEGASSGAAQGPNAFALTDENFEAFLTSVNRVHVKGEARDLLRQEWRRNTLFAQKAKDAALDHDPTYRAKLAQFEREALAQMYIDREMEKRLTDAELKSLYEERKERLATEEIHLAARFFPVANPRDLQANLAAKAQAEEVLREVSTGKDFLPEEIVSPLAGHATTPGVDHSGDLGWLPVAYAQSRFDADLSNPSEGAVIGPLNVKGGWYLLKIVEGPRKNPPEFERARRQLIEQERQRIVRELTADLGRG